MPAHAAAAEPIRQLTQLSTDDEHLHFHYPSRYQPMIEQLVDLGVPLFEQMETILGIDSMPPVNVWVLPELNKYFEYHELAHRAPPWAVGLSLSNQRTILLLHGTGRGGQVVDVPRTFAHELAHVAIDIARGGFAVPRWFNEGFAVMMADEWTFERMDVFIRATSMRTLIPMTELDRSFPPDHHTVSVAYAQSYHFVKMLHDDYGERVFADTLALVRAGTKFEQALEAVTNKPLDELEAQWLSRLDNSASIWAIFRDETAIFFGVSLLFLVALIMRRIRKHRQMKSMAAEESPFGWDYDASHYPLPGDNYHK